MKYEKWKIGNDPQFVITDNEEGFQENLGHIGSDALEYYGGALICESIWRKKDAHLIAAAPTMLEALENLENDNGAIPEHAWKMVQNAINLARNT